MSKPAWEYLTTHLPEIRGAVLPNTGSKIGEPGLALLLYLSGQTNKQGEFFMTAKTMQEETGMATLRQVEKLLAGFVALGWITPTGETDRYMGRGRPTPVYVLTLFPQYAQLFAQTLHKSEEIPSPQTVEKLSKPNREKDYLKNNETESEPEPDPQAGQGAGAWGADHDQLLADCLACEPKEGDKGQLVPWLIKQYRPIVLRALKDRPDTDLVGWCFSTRQEIQTPKRETPSPTSHAPNPSRPWDHASPDCPICNGQGTGNYWSDQEQKRVSWLCKCCPGGSYEGDEISTPSPTSPADIDRVKAELKHLRIVG
jgi:hypothetical protein